MSKTIMTITERLRTEFPGITAMIIGVIDALRAYRAYNRAVEDMEALKIVAERDAACGYIETTTKRECSSILRLSEVAVTDESEEDLIIQDRACWEGDIR